MTAKALPTLLDCRQLAERLNVKRATAETIMRSCPKITVGRRVYVTETAVAAYLKSRESDA